LALGEVLRRVELKTALEPGALTRVSGVIQQPKRGVLGHAGKSQEVTSHAV
jgi:hypothetical protein